MSFGGLSEHAEKQFLDKLITVEWMMKILWETFDYNDERLKAAIEKYYLFDSSTWRDIEKNPAQAVTVIMAFLRVFTRDDKLLTEMVDTFTKEGTRSAFRKADPYFKSLKQRHGDLVWLDGISYA